MSDAPSYLSFFTGSFLFPQHNLFPYLDLYTNVALGIDPSLRLAPAKVESVREALVRLGLESLQRRKPGELSGGQRQPVALARALVREQEITALLVSHQPGDALVASKRTAFICEGRVAALAPAAQLLADSEPPQLREYLGSK